MAADNKADTGPDGGRRATGAAARHALRRPGVRVQLGALLLREKLLSAEQLEEALAEKDETGDRLGEIVVRRGWVSGRALAHALAEQHELEYIDLAQTEIEALALSLLPERFARRYAALPIRFLGEDVVLVAVADPGNVRTSDELKVALGLNIRLTVAAPDDLEQTIDRRLPGRSQGRRPRHRAPQGARDGRPRRGSGGDERARDRARQLDHQPRDPGRRLRHPLRASGERAPRTRPRSTASCAG